MHYPYYIKLVFLLQILIFSKGEINSSRNFGFRNGDRKRFANKQISHWKFKGHSPNVMEQRCFIKSKFQVHDNELYRSSTYWEMTNSSKSLENSCESGNELKQLYFNRVRPISLTKSSRKDTRQSERTNRLQNLSDFKMINLSKITREIYPTKYNHNGNRIIVIDRENENRYKNIIKQDRRQESNARRFNRNRNNERIRENNREKNQRILSYRRREDHERVRDSRHRDNLKTFRAIEHQEKRRENYERVRDSRHRDNLKTFRAIEHQEKRRENYERIRDSRYRDNLKTSRVIEHQEKRRENYERIRDSRYRDNLKTFRTIKRQEKQRQDSNSRNKINQKRMRITDFEQFKTSRISVIPKEIETFKQLSMERSLKHSVTEKTAFLQRENRQTHEGTSDNRKQNRELSLNRNKITSKNSISSVRKIATKRNVNNKHRSQNIISNNRNRNIETNSIPNRVALKTMPTIRKIATNERHINNKHHQRGKFIARDANRREVLSNNHKKSHLNRNANSQNPQNSRSSIVNKPLYERSLSQRSTNHVMNTKRSLIVANERLNNKKVFNQRMNDRLNERISYPGDFRTKKLSQIERRKEKLHFRSQYIQLSLSGNRRSNAQQTDNKGANDSRIINGENNFVQSNNDVHKGDETKWLLSSYTTNPFSVIITVCLVLCEFGAITNVNLDKEPSIANAAYRFLFATVNS